MVTWTDHALAQLKNIHNYIAQDSAFYAKRVSEAIVLKTKHLDELPYKNRKTPEINDEQFREISQYAYRILYEIKSNDKIDVLAVIHKRSDFKAEDLP